MSAWGERVCNPCVDRGEVRELNGKSLSLSADEMR